MVARHSQDDKENARDEQAENDGEESAELDVEAGCDREQSVVWPSVE